METCHDLEIDDDYVWGDSDDSLADLLEDLSHEPVWKIGLEILQDDPKRWFIDTQIDDRDLALINASRLPWVDLGPESALEIVCV